MILAEILIWIGLLTLIYFACKIAFWVGRHIGKKVDKLKKEEVK
jgi:hypothetical protein